MSTNKVCLGSDNWSAAHPVIMQAIVDANKGYASPYGGDPWTEQAINLIQIKLKTNGKVFLVPTGTGANVFGLMLCCARHQSVICTDISHVHYQESGAFESIVGSKLLVVPHQNGKITPEEILKKLRNERFFGKHSTSPRVLSIAQPTEVGTMYSLDELRLLGKLCKDENLLFHIDGSRLYNAVAAQNIDLSDIVTETNVDVLSLGGTKNGLMGAEALIINNPELFSGSDHLHKQTLQLLSKMRFTAAQYIPFLDSDLWRTLASQANDKAQKIGAIIRGNPHCRLSYPVDTNQIFFTTSPHMAEQIQEKIVCLLWDRDKSELRFIASWSTTDDDVKAVCNIFKNLVCV